MISLWLEDLNAFPDSKMQIFNRWGNEVYNSKSYQNNWDGGESPDGVYFFILSLSNNEVINGPVTIKRN